MGLLKRLVSSEMGVVLHPNKALVISSEIRLQGYYGYPYLDQLQYYQSANKPIWASPPNPSFVTILSIALRGPLPHFIRGGTSCHSISRLPIFYLQRNMTEEHGTFVASKW